MFTLLATLLLSTAQADPLVIEVDADVHDVIVRCGSKEERYRAYNGRASIHPAPTTECDVFLVKQVGKVKGQGTLRCDDSGCHASAGGVNAPVAAGDLVVVLEPGTHASHLEVDCTSGYRERVAVSSQQATFHKVPGEECTLTFKGGAPGRFRPITPGRWTCRLEGSVAVCEQ